MFTLAVSERELLYLRIALRKMAEQLQPPDDELLEDAYDDLMMVQHVARRLEALQAAGPTG